MTKREVDRMEAVDKKELEAKVKEMYRAVAESPKGQFHFDIGRNLAEKLGYPTSDLDKLPKDAIDSFAGVGYHFDLAEIREGESVLDLGCGSGMDVFFAALKAGNSGKVMGLDMTEEQLRKAETLKAHFGWDTVTVQNGYIDALPFPDKSFDVVVSNGVINLFADSSLGIVILSLASGLARYTIILPQLPAYCSSSLEIDYQPHHLYASFKGGIG